MSKEVVMLRDLPRNSPLRVKVIGGEWKEATFHHLDGMYSYCTIDDGGSGRPRVFHLHNTQKLELVDGRWQPYMG